MVIVTEWDAFRTLNLNKVKPLPKAPVLANLRNIYEPAEVRTLGFPYYSVGHI